MFSENKTLSDSGSKETKFNNSVELQKRSREFRMQGKFLKPDTSVSVNQLDIYTKTNQNNKYVKS